METQNVGHLGKTYYQSYLELSKIVNICENFSLKRPSSKHGGPINNILNIKIKMPTIYFNFMIHKKDADHAADKHNEDAAKLREGELGTCASRVFLTCAS